LYKFVKTSCILAGGCEIISVLEVCNGVAKILSRKLRLLQ